jgi:apolipoprotein N-acyltransferase
MTQTAGRPHFAIVTGSLVASVVALYFGTGLHPIWWLTWLAPLPLLLIAPRISFWLTAAASLIAAFAGGMNMWHYFRHDLGIPLLVVVIFTLLPACMLACGVLLFRWCALRGALARATLIFPAFWICVEFLTASVSIHSTYGNLAYNQMDFLPILQIASVTGIWGISFCVLLFSATIAVICSVPGQAARKKLLASSVAVFLIGVLAFGEWRLHATRPASSVTVAVIASDLPEDRMPTTQEDTLRVLRDYSAQAKTLSTRHVQAIVLPEKIGVVHEAYLSQVDSLLSDTAAGTQAAVVAGLVRYDSSGSWNEARIYMPGGSAPLTYEKHHMLPPFESQFTVGTSRTVLQQPSGIWGVTICKDMDFPKLSRDYGLDGTGLLLVPAWDFDADGWLHGRMAILRGVENGFSIARAPRHGILTVSDDRGRILAERPTNAEPFVTLLAQAPVHHETTLYARWGNWFAWLCVALLLWSMPSGRKQPNGIVPQ